MTVCPGQRRPDSIGVKTYLHILNCCQSCLISLVWCLLVHAVKLYLLPTQQFSVAKHDWRSCPEPHRGVPLSYKCVLLPLLTPGKTPGSSAPHKLQRLASNKHLYYAYVNIVATATQIGCLILVARQGGSWAKSSLQGKSRKETCLGDKVSKSNPKTKSRKRQAWEARRQL